MRVIRRHESPAGRGSDWESTLTALPVSAQGMGTNRQSAMEFTPSVNETLSWLGRVRFLIITFLVAVVVALRQLTPIALPVRPLVLLIALWYALAAAYVLAAPLVAGGALACAAADGLRPAGHHGRGLLDRRAGQLLHFALSAWHFDGQHSVFAARRVSRGGSELLAARRDRRAELLRVHSREPLHQCQTCARPRPGLAAISSHFSPWLISAAFWRRICARRASSWKRKAQS